MVAHLSAVATRNYASSLKMFLANAEIIFIYFHSISYMKSPSFNGMEKAMAPHSSALAWRIPWTEEPGGQQSMGSLRVGHD